MSRSQAVFRPFPPPLAETTREGDAVKSLQAVIPRKLGVGARGTRDETALPSQMAVKIFGGALIQRRESAWVSVPDQNNQAGRAGVRASDLTDGGRGFLSTCWREAGGSAHTRATLTRLRLG